MAAQAAAAALVPDAMAGLYLLPGGAGAQAAGAVFLFGGTALMVLAQLHLGASWRVGIDAGARPGLVTGGLYRFCRNPIFLSMFLALAGLAVLLPTWFSAAALVGAVVGVRAQVLEEEAYLAAAYGAAYRGYARRVGRFLPGLGRLG